MTDHYDALRNAASPTDFCVALEAIACELAEQGAQLDSDWQDIKAGRPWRNISKDLDKVAAKFGT